MPRPGTLIKIGEAFAKRIKKGLPAESKILRVKWHDVEQPLRRIGKEAESQLSKFEARRKGAENLIIEGTKSETSKVKRSSTLLRKGTVPISDERYIDPTWTRYKAREKEIGHVVPAKTVTIPVIDKKTGEKRFIKREMPEYIAKGYTYAEGESIPQGEFQAHALYREGPAIKEPLPEVVMMKRERPSGAGVTDLYSDYVGPKPSYIRKGTGEIVSNPQQVTEFKEEYFSPERVLAQITESKHPLRAPSGAEASPEIAFGRNKQRGWSKREAARLKEHALGMEKSYGFAGRKEDSIISRGMYENTAIRRGPGKYGRSAIYSRTVHRPDPIRVKAKTKLSKIQTAMYALRQAESGNMAPQTERAISPGYLNQSQAMNFPSTFEPTQEKVLGRLNEVLDRGTKDQRTIVHDMPYEDALKKIMAQEGLPEEKRTLTPATGGIPPVKRLLRMEGNEPVFERLRWQAVSPVKKEMGGALKRITRAQKYEKTSGIGRNVPISDVADYIAEATMMWKAIGGMRSLKGKMWERNKAVVFRGTGGDKKNLTGMDAFIRVASEYLADPEATSKKYPKALVESIEQAYNVRRGAME